MQSVLDIYIRIFRLRTRGEIWHSCAKVRTPLKLSVNGDPFVLYTKKMLFQYLRKNIFNNFISYELVSRIYILKIKFKIMPKFLHQVIQYVHLQMNTFLWERENWLLCCINVKKRRYFRSLVGSPFYLLFPPLTWFCFLLDNPSPQPNSQF